MPFSTDNSWPAGLLKIFELCRKEGQPYENRYYGPYTRLLAYCFGDSFTFFVGPQSAPSDLVPRETVDFIVYVIVYDAAHRPVLMAEIKDDSWASNARNRLEADKQIRHRYKFMLHTCPLPCLWGLSLLGTSTHIYHGDVATGAITPPPQAHPHGDRVPPPELLEGEWNLDILSQEGFNRMKEVVRDIMAAISAL